METAVLSLKTLHNDPAPSAVMAKPSPTRGAVTVRLATPAIAPLDAVTSAAPADSAVASPASDTVATVGMSLIHEAAMFCELPSLKWPTETYCRIWPVARTALDGTTEIDASTTAGTEATTVEMTTVSMLPALSTL
ncbi:MAG: hypothetical protein A2506_07430 [Elusimicrobia bacterium RIFOXYD12_FULL_66_9]|nr:MAG: hypothetical protein A2506_07430 [Elusimicrobia bacterium RIFOXYD12_FULL_66_9]